MTALPGRAKATWVSSPPQVFVEIVKLVAPYLVGQEAFDTRALYTELCNITG
jgi:hypothetical protein